MENIFFYDLPTTLKQVYLSNGQLDWAGTCRNSRKPSTTHPQLSFICHLGPLDYVFVTYFFDGGTLFRCKWFVSLVAMLFRIELTVFFGAIFCWCDVFEFEVLSEKRSTVTKSLGTLGAMGPHGQGADTHLAFPAGRCAVAVDRDMDLYLP